MFDSLAVQFVVLWAVIDPVGSVPVYLAKTIGLPIEARRKIALNAVLIAAGILVFFLIGGQILLESMQIPLPAFQAAGGLVLLLFALTMIFGESKPDQEIRMSSNLNELAVYPLAVPSIASPGAMMAIVLLTDNHRFSISDQFITAGIMVLVLAITYLLLLAANRIQHLIGNAGAAIISRVMGLILAAIAVNNLLIGVRDFFVQVS
ncbi:MarC family protein [Mannheimia varigena]|uniref:MarC family protein n=1 Tax=Mannheimia varigena TaxID=85404 RepID=UPI0003E3C275|nr:MarC family protein [Mannheimia varigena]AHG77972.1 Multiple antibiotic resistance (MarC)-related protein [Mannheimia varigena USDA-ARS-USMARC-1312]AHG79283.1 Multiple antibiotic resistance (MarC)-related protein [Mannheimia varigena USDA-ARS-USMARC-1388]MDY2947867.1 MarC family protein [Mannheimia varigena]QLB16636.1 MarC family transcriptional regulator [Mannheimia varigena]QLD32694.1 MarC family protein [Mannheimia varigena]